jgi:hypothetical protein
VSRGGQEGGKEYLERLMKVIPAEVVGLYVVGSGFIPQTATFGLVGWFAFCLVAAIIVRTFGNADPAKGLPPQPVPIAISVIAFVIWAYSLGGPFSAFGLWVPWVGSLLVLAWSFVIPYFYKGPVEP